VKFSGPFYPFSNIITGLLFGGQVNDVYTGRHFEIIQKRKEVKSRTLQVRKNYNRTAREQGSGL